MLALWLAVGVALGFRLSSRRAVITGIVYGSCLGFASTFYGYRGHLLFMERIVEISIGVAIGAICGAVIGAIGSAASRAVVGPPKNREGG
jgi:hypothetical protein